MRRSLCPLTAAAPHLSAACALDTCGTACLRFRFRFPGSSALPITLTFVQNLQHACSAYVQQAPLRLRTDKAAS